MPTDLALLCWQMALGFSLAATTGLRAFLPLFAASAAAHLGQVQLSPAFAWLGSDAALLVFGSAVLFEVLADKVPALDHAMDAAGVFVKPAAATLLTASLFTSLDPVLASALGLATGGVTAGGVHLVKANARVLSTAFTAGIANPLLSLGEDVLAAAGIVFALLVPIAAAFATAGLALVALVWIARRVAARRPAPVHAATGG